MKKIIRVPGLVTFFAVVSLLGAFIYFYAESIAKASIEQGLGWYLGAEVNVESVNIGWSPFVVKVNQLQATDAAAPELNLVQFASASAGVDLGQYLLGKIIIEEVTVESLGFAKKRAQPGAVYRPPEQSIIDELNDSVEEQVKPASLELPDPTKLLDDSNLKTVKAAKHLEATYRTEKATLEQIQQQVPDQARLKQYEAEVKKITNAKIDSIADVQKLSQQLQELKAQFNKDKAAIKQAKTQITTAKTNLQNAVSDLRKAPEQDWQDIEQTYQLDNLDAADFAHMFFGEQARVLYDKAMAIYHKIKPLIDSHQENKEAAKQKAQAASQYGKFIHFKDDNPLPELLVRKALFSLSLPAGEFELSMLEGTHQHWVRNQPTQLAVTAQQLAMGGQFDMNSELRLSPEQKIAASGQWQMSDLTVSETQLSDSDNLKLALTESALHGKGQFELNHDQVDSVSHIELRQPKLDGSSASSWGQSVVDGLKEMDNIAFQIDAKGAVTAPEIDIHSQLDEVLRKAVQRQLQARLNKFKGKVQSGLNDKLASALKLEDSANADLLNIDSLLNNGEETLSKLLESKVESYVEKQVEQKLQDKVGGELKKLFGDKKLPF